MLIGSSHLRSDKNDDQLHQANNPSHQKPQVSFPFDVRLDVSVNVNEHDVSEISSDEEKHFSTKYDHLELDCDSGKGQESGSREAGHAHKKGISASSFGHEEELSAIRKAHHAQILAIEESHRKGLEKLHAMEAQFLIHQETTREKEREHEKEVQTLRESLLVAQAEHDAGVMNMIDDMKRAQECLIAMEARHLSNIAQRDRRIIELLQMMTALREMVQRQATLADEAPPPVYEE